MSVFGIRLHFRLLSVQIFEWFDDTTSDMGDDDQRGLPSFRLSIQDGTFRRGDAYGPNYL